MATNAGASRCANMLLLSPRATTTTPPCRNPHVQGRTSGDVPPMPCKRMGLLSQDTYNPSPQISEQSQQIGQQIGRPIFRQNRLPVPWISVPDPKHTFLMVAQQVESCGNPKYLSIFGKVFSASVCTWSLSSTMAVQAGGLVVYALAHILASMGSVPGLIFFCIFCNFSC